MKSPIENQDGFTLVELLVALTIFAIGLLGVAGMQITAIRTNGTANTLTAATVVAEGAMEDILSRQVDDPIFSSSTSTPDPVWGGMTTLTGAGSFKTTYAVALNYNGVSNVARVTVTVTGAGRTVSLVGFKRTI